MRPMLCSGVVASSPFRRATLTPGKTKITNGINIMSAQAGDCPEIGGITPLRQSQAQPGSSFKQHKVPCEDRPEPINLSRRPPAWSYCFGPYPPISGQSRRKPLMISGDGYVEIRVETGWVAPWLGPGWSDANASRIVRGPLHAAPGIECVTAFGSGAHIFGVGLVAISGIWSKSMISRPENITPNICPLNANFRKGACYGLARIAPSEAG